jgi:hypothetical protein
MALSDDDVREILRILDESPLEELHIETDGLSLHVLRGAAAATPRPPAGVAGTVVEVCSENAELVEYGQPLFRLEPE